MSQANYDWKNPEWLFNKVTGYIFAVILLFTTLALLIGAFRLFYGLYELIDKSGVTGNYMYVFSDVLTLVILLELSRSLFQYFMEHTIRLPVILDAGIVFVLREVMIGLFEHKLKTDDIYAYSALLLVLGVIRIGFGFYYEKKSCHAENKAKNQLTPALQKDTQ
jgi:uncharacterized membrane protein (DUF373 family)